MSDTLIKIRVGVAIILTMLLGYAVMKIMRIQPIGVDDANILFVYSKHLAAGEGLVYNIGSERVEGYSSTLWMLVGAIGFLFTAFPYPLFLSLNVLIIGGALGYALHFVEEALPQPHASSRRTVTFAGFLFLAWVVANPSFYLWTITSMMETGLWAGLLITASVLVLKAAHARKLDAQTAQFLSVLNAGLVLTRPEGIAWAAVFCAAAFLVVRAFTPGEKPAYVRWLLVVGATASVFVALVLFRLAYFGFPWPNTYYVKVTPDKLYNLRFGVEYLLAFARAQPLAVPLIALAALGFCRRLPAVVLALLGRPGALDSRSCGEFLSGGIVVTGIALPVLMGGDIFGAFRFFQPVWPLLILPIYYVRRPVWLVRPRHRVVVVALYVMILCAFTFANQVRWSDLRADRAYVKHLYQLSQRLSTTGDYLQRLFTDYERGLPSLGVSAAGGSKINYPGLVIDLMGLNFTPMAHHSGDKKGVRGHAAFNKDVFWEYAPDMLEPNLCPRNRPPENLAAKPDGWLYSIYRGLPADQQFVDTYSFVAISVPGTSDRLCTYVSNAWLADMQSAGGFTVELVR